MRDAMMAMLADWRFYAILAGLAMFLYVGVKLAFIGCE